MAIYDITRPLSSETTTYPGDPPFRLSIHSSLSQGDPFDLTSIAVSSHLGTHVDACSHFIQGGASIDRAPLDALVGAAFVYEFQGTGPVGREELEGAGIPETTQRLLLRMAPRFLSEEGARWMLERRFQLLGTDAISIDSLDSEDFPAHRFLLSSGILVVESLDLTGVPARDYMLYCLPLKVVGAEAAPARVILVC